jgi:hypothetical protein
VIEYKGEREVSSIKKVREKRREERRVIMVRVVDDFVE